MAKVKYKEVKPKKVKAPKRGGKGAKYPTTAGGGKAKTGRA
tara:strand:+ start:188 stop:310 length:123 start_codon:yes stop_codon:yes gene_type:complete